MVNPQGLLNTLLIIDELKEDRKKSKIFFRNNYKSMFHPVTFLEYQVAFVSQEIIKWLIKTANKKYVDDLEQQKYAEMDDFIPICNYSPTMEILKGELGYDFTNDERIIIRL